MKANKIENIVFPEKEKENTEIVFMFKSTTSDENFI